MLEILISILGILITIFFVIGTHEYAHFIVARLLNIKVLRFSIGFGKTLLRWFDKKGTEYVIALIPLGGYVKMLDENEGEVPASEKHLAFNRQPFYKKFLVVLAGPVMNILCALALYWLIFTIGFVTIKPIIGKITPDSIAAESGLTNQLEIVSVDGHATMSWMNVILRILSHVGNQDYVKIGVKNISADTAETKTLNLANWHMDNLTPDPLVSLGIIPYVPELPLVIGAIAKNSPAGTSLLQVGDKILAINKKPVKDWQEIVTLINHHPDKNLNFTVERNGIPKDISVPVGFKRNLLMQKTGYLGIGPKVEIPKEFKQQVKYSPLKAVSRAWQEIVDFTYLNFMLLGKMITGKLSMQSLGGPITIFESAGSALNYGFLPFISFLAFLSLSIGIINLLPIPGLDGGHLIIQIVESIIGKSVPERVLLLLFRLGFLFIILLLVQALVNDILRLV